MDRKKSGSPESDREALHHRVSKKELDAALAALKEQGRSPPSSRPFERPTPVLSKEHQNWLTHEEAALKEAIRIVKVAQHSLSSIESLLAKKGINAPVLDGRNYINEPVLQKQKVEAQEELERSIHHLTHLKTALAAYMMRMNAAVESSFQSGTQDTPEARTNAAWLVQLRQLEERIELAEHNPF